MCSSYGIRWVWLRLTAAYGPMDDRAHLLPSVIQDLLAARRPSVSAGTQAWDYLYVEDVAEAIRAVVRHGSAAGILNLSADGRVDGARARRAGARSDRSRVSRSASASAPGNAVSMRSDPSRLRDLTGWEPKVALPEGLRATVEWEREYAR